MKEKLLGRECKFSIRKFSIGICSALIGVIIVGTGQLTSADTLTSESESVVTNQSDSNQEIHSINTVTLVLNDSVTSIEETASDREFLPIEKSDESYTNSSENNDKPTLESISEVVLSPKVNSDDKADVTTNERNDIMDNDKVEVTSQLPQHYIDVDDQDEKIIYNNGWYHEKLSGEFNDTQSWMNFTRADDNGKNDISVEAYFIGTGIDVYGYTDPNHGVYKVILDGKEMPYQEGQGNSEEIENAHYFSGYSPNRTANQELIKLHQLQSGPHSLKVILDPKINDVSENIGIQLDRFRVYGDDAKLLTKGEVEKNYPNLIPKNTEPLAPSQLSQISAIEVNQDEKLLVLPDLPGQVSIIGSDKQGVIDLDNHIYKPLTDQTVTIMLQQKQDEKIITKEFTVTVKGLHEDEGVGLKPVVAPSVQQWYGREGKTQITNQTVLKLEDSSFEKAADIYQMDLASRGVNVASQQDVQDDSSSITFKKVTDKGYGNEGYGIVIDHNKVVIEAQTNTGAFYATRTLLQMGEKDLQNGEIRDFPAFAHRGTMIDVGRKFIPYDTLREILLNMSYYKMNDLQLHLNDNYIFLKEHVLGKNMTKQEELDYVLNHAESGFRVETDIKGENGISLTSKDHYTKKELRDLISLAKDLGINVVPEIDTPGHALAFVKVRPDLMYQGKLSSDKHNVERVAMLDLDGKYDETLAFVKSVYDKLLDGEDAPLHGVKTIHIGTDEYYGNSDTYRRYVNDLMSYIRSKGYTPRVWGSMSIKKGTVPVKWQGAEVDIWNVGWQNPEEVLTSGGKVINITDIPTYSVPNGNNKQAAYGDYANFIKQYTKWEPNDFRTGGGKLLNRSNPNIIGGGHAIWNDNIDLHETGMTSYDIFKRFFKSMQVTAEKTWLSDRIPKDFEQRYIPKEIYAPRTNPDKFVKDSELFNISPETLDHYKAVFVQNKDGLVFNKESKISHLVGNVGPDSVLSLDFMLDGNGLQEFSSSGKNKIYLSDKDGKVAYQMEHLHIQFDKELKKGQRYELTFVTKPEETELYVNGEKVNRLEDPKHPKLSYTSFVLPLETIGGFEGYLYRAQLSKGNYISPYVVTPDQIEKVTASSEESSQNTEQADIQKAFDNDPMTYWHSKWKGDKAPYSVTFTLKDKILVNGLTYLPRLDLGNGTVEEYEIFATQDGQRLSVAKGQLAVKLDRQTLSFEPVKTDKLELVITKGKGGFASAAEIQLLKPIQKTVPAEGVKSLEFVKPELILNQEVIPYKTIEKASRQLAKGERRIVTKGENGERLLIKEVIKNGDKIVKSTELPSLISKDAIDEVVEVGTMSNEDHYQMITDKLSQGTPNHKMSPHQLSRQHQSENKVKGALSENASKNMMTVENTDAPVAYSRVVKNHDGNQKNLPDTGSKELGTLAGLSLLGLGSSIILKRKKNESCK